jgi:hypothetical protein
MDINVVQTSAYDVTQERDMVVIGIFEEDTLTGIAAAYDEELGGAITRRIADGDFKPKLGNSFTVLHRV